MSVPSSKSVLFIVLAVFGALATSTACGGHAAQGRLRLCQPGRRRRLDFAARRRAQGNGKGARRQGRHQVRGKRAGGRRRRARDPRARAKRLPADFHDVVRLHESDDQGRQAVSEDVFRARDRLQDRQERRHLQRALLRRSLSRRHRRGADDQVERRRLRRGVSDSRSRDGHQRIHPRHAQRQPECGDQGRLGQHLVRPGPRARSRRYADLAGRRRADQPHRLDRRRAGRRGEEGVRDRLPFRHVQIRSARAADRGHAPVGRVLHEGSAECDRRQMEAGQHLGRASRKA